MNAPYPLAPSLAASPQKPALRRLLHATTRTIVRAAYRYRADLDTYVPPSGPAILVANHVTFVDALLVIAGMSRTPRFVMHAHWVGALWWARWLFRVGAVIPIAKRSEDPTVYAAALDRIDQCLAEGELLLFFPEGRLTDDGEIDFFRPGIEGILARRPVPVVPVSIRGAWDSVWSKRGKRWILRALRPYRLRIEVVADRALDPSVVTADRLRTQVLALRGPFR